MNFDELVIRRRSVRKYTEESVSVELLKELIDTSILAPSAGNMQPWKYAIVNDKNLLKEISDDCKANLLQRIESNPNDFASRYRHMFENPEFNIFYNAPALVMILGDTNTKNYRVDCTLAASYLMFGAVSKGLGTCWVNFALSISDSLKGRIGLPLGYDIVAPIIVGYPATIPEIPKRKSPEINIMK